MDSAKTKAVERAVVPAVRNSLFRAQGIKFGGTLAD